MIKPQDEAVRLLAPVWEAVMSGRVDLYDEHALVAQVSALPQQPASAQVSALDNELHSRLDTWSQQSPEAGTLAGLLVPILINVAAARCVGDASVLRWALYTAARALELSHHMGGNPRELEIRIHLLREAVRLSPPGDPARVGMLNNLSLALRDRYHLRSDTTDLDQCIALLQEAVPLASAGRDYLLSVNNLCGALGIRYTLRGDPADLHEQLGLLPKAIALTSAGNPIRPSLLNNWGLALEHRYTLRSDPADLDECINALEDAVRLSAIHDPLYPERLTNLGVALGMRYQARGNLADLDERIRRLERAVRLTPTGPNRAGFLTNLAGALGNRYDAHGNPVDLDERIRLLQEAALLAPAGHTQHPMILNNLGNALAERHRLHGKTVDLDERIRLLQEAVSLTLTDSPDLPLYLGNLGNALAERYRVDGRAADLDESIRLLRRALDLTPWQSPDRPGRLSNLGAVLGDRYAQCGGIADLDEQISLFQEAVNGAPAGSPERTAYLANQGQVLMDRYARSGNATDLDESIRQLREALDLTPGQSPDRAGRLNSLGNALREQYHLRGDPADLDEWIRLLEEVVQRTPEGPSRPLYLSNLGAALGTRYRLRHHPTDLDEQIRLFEEAVTLTPAGPDRPMYLNNLGSTRGERYRRHGKSADLDEWVRLLQEAVNLTPSGPSRPLYLNNLGLALWFRYRLNHAPADLEEQIRLLQEAVDRTPANSPERPTYLSNLGNALGTRYAAHPNAADLDEWIRLLTDALAGAVATNAPPIAQILGLLHLRLADTNDPTYHLPAARAAFQHGINALERMLAVVVEPDELALLDDHGVLYDLLITTHLRLAASARKAQRTAEAARHDQDAYLVAERAKGRRAAALLSTPALRPTHEDPEVQAALLEIARLRHELAQLDRRLELGIEIAPLGADNAGLEHLAKADDPLADAAGVSAAPFAMGLVRLSIPGASSDLPQEDRTALTERASVLWQHLRFHLEQVARNDPNYAAVRGFAEPYSPHEVAAALPPDGALLLLYPLDDTIACFVLRPASDEASPVVQATTVPLHYKDRQSEILLDGRGAVVALVQQAVKPAASDVPGTRNLESMLHTLADALHPALAPLLPPANPADPPALVLVPTGALHRLPLHALPWPNLDQRLLDGYTVSYATTADVLVLSGRRPAAPSGAVALAPGLPPTPPIPGTLALASALARLTGGTLLLREQASRAALLEGHVAIGRRWVLIATHGRAGKHDQARAGLLLSDDEGEPAWLTAAEILTLLELEGPHTPGPEYLGLGACSTHADDPQAGDRLAGLLGALLYRGARSVQMTLWRVRDDASTLIGIWTWEALLAGETDKAAALREAVQRLRRCTGPEAAEHLRRLAEGLAGVLPAEDPAHGQLEAMAQAVEKQGQPFLRSPDWAPFVLHGAPITTPLQ